MVKAKSLCYSETLKLMEMKLGNSKDASKPDAIGGESQPGAEKISSTIMNILDKQSAEDVVQIDLQGKSAIADRMIIASGRSNRHVSALSDYVLRGLREIDVRHFGIEGDEQCDWVLIDFGDVILHLFHPEVRNYYSLEKLWSVPPQRGSDGTPQTAP